MIVARLTIKYDRGLSHNEERDLVAEGSSAAALAGVGTKTANGEIIRGLGTKWRSEADRDRVKELDKKAATIYKSFSSQFLRTPIDGLYVVPHKGAAKDFLANVDTTGVSARVSEFELLASGQEGIDATEVVEWTKRIKNQLTSVSLGRSKEADEDGLRALETLSRCPVLSKGTGARIREMVAMLRSEQMTRVELKRNIETMEIEVEQATLAPRRVPTMEAA